MNQVGSLAETDEGQTTPSMAERRDQAVAAIERLLCPMQEDTDANSTHLPSSNRLPVTLGAAKTSSEQLGTAPPGYEILSVLGRGGMGVVYKACHIQLNRVVALKMILAGSHAGPEDRVRFLTEAEAVAALQHPQIVSLLEFGDHQGLPFFTLEFVPGGSLADRLQGVPLPPRDAARLIEQLARGIDYAHHRGIVHRDLKPANILLAEDGTPKITDFGLARRVEVSTGLTATGAVMGTPSYMAPEQAGGESKHAGPAADIYALGAILYECLSGRPPFRAATVVETVLQVMKQEAVSVRQVQPQTPMDLVTICHKCLEKDPRKRYASALGLAEDCSAFLENRPIRARPIGRLERGWRWCQRNPAVATLVGVIFLALVAGMCGTTWGMVTAWRQEEIALAAAAKEKSSNEMAQLRLKQIEKGNAIITGIFAELDVRKVKSGNRPLERVLADRLIQAAEQLEGEAVGDPVAVATLQNRLGKSLINLGSAKEAIGLCEKALATRKAKLGTDHLDTLSTMNTLALAYKSVGQFDEALPLYAETLKVRKEKLGPKHPSTLISMNNLALAYQEAGKIDQALPLFEETYQYRKSHQGIDDPSTLTSMNNLAGGYKAAGKLDKALPLYEEAFQLRKARIGPDHPDTLNSMNGLAAAYQEARKLDKAIPLYEETLRLRKTKLGLDHPSTLNSMNSLAECYRAADQLDKAFSLFEETLTLRKARLGLDHPDTLASMNSLAVAYKAANQLDKAIPLYEQTLQHRKAKLGPDHPSTLTSMNNLAIAYKTTGKIDKALPLYEETVRLRKVKLGFDHPATLTSMNNLALAYKAGGQLDKALPLYEETLRLRTARLGSDHSDTLQTLRNLAKAYLEAMQQPKAVPLYERYIAAMEKGLGVNSLKSASTLTTVSGELLKAGEFNLAERYLKRCLAIREKGEPEAWSTFSTQSLLGSALLGQKKYVDAEAFLLKGYEGMNARRKTISTSGRARLPETADQLIELYTAMNRPDEAKKWQAVRAKYLSKTR